MSGIIDPRDSESKLIFSMVSNDILPKVKARGIYPDSLLHWGSVYGFIDEYYKKYRKMPSMETVYLQHPEFPMISKDGIDTEFLLDLTVKNAKKKRIRETLSKAIDDIDDVESDPDEVARTLRTEASEIALSDKVMSNYLDERATDRLKEYQERRKINQSGQSVGLKTGIISLDQADIVMMEGDLVMLIGPPGAGKCVTGDTEVLDASSNKYVKIKDFTTDMSVCSLDEKNSKEVIQNNPVLLKQGVQDVFELRTKHEHIKLTRSHPLLTPNGWRKLEELKVGNLIQTAYDFRKITAIDYVGKEETYDLSLPLYHNFIANDIFIHNSFILEKMCIASHISGKKVLYVCPEMTRRNVALRFDVMEGRYYGHIFSLEALRKGDDINELEYQQWLESIEDRKNFVIVDSIDGGKFTVDKLEALVKEHNPDIIGIDSLTQFTTLSGALAIGWVDVIEIANAIKTLATASKRTFIAIGPTVGETFDSVEPAQMGEMGLSRGAAYKPDVIISVSKSLDDKIRHVRVVKMREGKETPDKLDLHFEPDIGWVE